jgi:hypothetical protein
VDRLGEYAAWGCVDSVLGECWSLLVELWLRQRASVVVCLSFLLLSLISTGLDSGSLRILMVGDPQIMGSDGSLYGDLNVAFNDWYMRYIMWRFVVCFVEGVLLRGT